MGVVSFKEHDVVKLLVEKDNIRPKMEGVIVHIYGQGIPVVVVEFSPDSEVMDINVGHIELVWRGDRS